jgi:hypothetical protein
MAVVVLQLVDDSFHEDAPSGPVGRVQLVDLEAHALESSVSQLHTGVGADHHTVTDNDVVDPGRPPDIHRPPPRGGPPPWSRAARDTHRATATRSSPAFHRAAGAFVVDECRARSWSSVRPRRGGRCCSSAIEAASDATAPPDGYRSDVSRHQTAPRVGCAGVERPFVAGPMTHDAHDARSKGPGREQKPVRAYHSRVAAMRFICAATGIVRRLVDPPTEPPSEAAGCERHTPSIDGCTAQERRSSWRLRSTRGREHGHRRRHASRSAASTSVADGGDGHEHVMLARRQKAHQLLASGRCLERTARHASSTPLWPACSTR